MLSLGSWWSLFGVDDGFRQPLRCTVECHLSKLQPSEHVGQPNDLPIYCFLINTHIPWQTSVAWEDGSTCAYFAALNHWWFGFSSFAVLSFLLHLWPCLHCGSENVVCNSPKMKALCAEYSAEIWDLWSLEEWLELLTDFSRVWDWKADCVQHHYEHDEHVPCQASGLRKIQSYRQSQSWHVWMTDIPLYSYYTFIFELTISTKLRTFSCTLCTHDFVLQSDWHYQI